MNIFFLMAKEGGGGVELVTSPLDAGDILDGTCGTLFVKAVSGSVCACVALFKAVIGSMRTGVPWV